MKGKLIVIVAFVLAFLLVTGGIVYLNTMYTNIFAFDFTPAGSPDKQAVEKGETGDKQSEEKAEEENKNAEQKPEDEDPEEDMAIYFNTDSIRNAAQANMIDSAKIKQAIKDSVKNAALQDSINNLKQQLKNLALIEQQKRAVEDSVRRANQTAIAISASDSSYKSWLKKTVSLYEVMDSRKAAKIILTYSDNVAKDILYAMKKKKAAEILAQYSPEIVNRITKIQ